jgi:serine/threonine-protein kinase
MTFADDLERYQLDERIATGGMGEVWRGTDTVLHRPVAIKLLKAELADDAEFRTRFETEARHAASLHHPGIAAVFDFGDTSSPAQGGHRPYLVMELVDGKPLSALLRRGTQMPAEQVTALLAQVADALGAAHRTGIVHRDIKPANLLVTPDRHVKVTDFGIARARDGVTLTRTGQVMGTPQYLSPEQAEGRPSSSASDVYSLGVVLFECLAGRRPFDAESPVATALAHVREPVPDLPANVPAALAAVVRRCLDKDPKRRFRDGAALAAALRDPAGAGSAPVRVDRSLGEPIGTPTTSIPPATAVLTGLPPATAYSGDPVARKQSGGWLWLVAILLGALLVLVGWALWTNFNGTEDPVNTPDPTTSATTTATDNTVEFPASVCVGQIDDVAGSITRRELSVTRAEQPNPGDEVAGRVIDCNPTGTLNKGQTVTVRFWGAAPTPTPSPTPTPTGSPTTAATTPAPSTTPTTLLPSL